MKISLNWINDYVDTKGLDINWLVGRLNVIAIEIESIIETGEDIIFNIDNKSIISRPYLWCHYGVAREIAALTGRELKEIDYVNEGYLKSVCDNILELEAEGPSKCLRKSAIEVGHIVKELSPEPIVNRLVNCGVKPVNLILDLANYVALDIGQKIEIYEEGSKAVIEAAVFDGSNKDTSLTAVAICRYVRLLQEYMYEAEVTSALYDKKFADSKTLNIIVEHKYIEDYMGETIDNITVAETLRSLKYLVYELEDTYSIGVPSFRSACGLSSKEAIVGELSRILGCKGTACRSLYNII